MWDLWDVGDFCRDFCCWRAGFYSAEVRVARVPDWLLVRTLGEVYLERVVSFTFLLTPLQMEQPRSEERRTMFAAYLRKR